ncbi:MAG TPA: NAD(P)-dependent alcohol dehydrogenase [Nitrosomonas europaea]|uniref:NAD(P)-dependent alcohol dehydrogenase n=1 Tax=Nitrosomonas europaea TaxID=915 RepID=UPI002C05A738|nr:NAD(P)-dependent alcohol dehydrogenase [Nitrosomonas europaea]HUM73069.1 NAD(P)-dependent alcohol dehydrogenase [Nitrosomonas europaea]
MRRIRAAVVHQKGGPFQIEDLMLEAPRTDEVLVRIVATGMCHTDMVARDQLYEVPLPVVLGHEGSGIVEQIGDGVKKVAVGDHVVLTYMWCGHCRPCLRGDLTYCEHFYALNFGGAREDGSTSTYRANDAREPVHDHFFGQSSFGTFALVHERNVIKVPETAPLELLGPLGCGIQTFGQSSFGTFALVHERNVIKVPETAPLELLGPLGCGIQTGAGAVINALKVSPGSSFAAFGGGAVGLSAIMAARAAGATTIISIDVVPSRLALAMELGATHTVNSHETDPVEAVHKITGGGADFTLESSGRPAVLRQAIDALAIRGTCGIVGAPALGTEASFDVNGVMTTGKRIIGIVEGDSKPDIFIPTLVELYQQGKFPFDRPVKFYSLDQINQAAEDSEKGITIKPIIRLQS